LSFPVYLKMQIVQIPIVAKVLEHSILSIEEAYSARDVRDGIMVHAGKDSIKYVILMH